MYYIYLIDKENENYGFNTKYKIHIKFNKFFFKALNILIYKID